MASSVSYSIPNLTSEKGAPSIATSNSLAFSLSDVKEKSWNEGTTPMDIKVGENRVKHNYMINELYDEQERSDKEVEKLSLDEIVRKMNDTLFIPQFDATHENEFKNTTLKYNRFKVANPNLALQKGFGHVFFVRPSCNILSGNTSTGIKLKEELQYNELFYYTWKNSPRVVKELVNIADTNHDFMFSLSNAISSFSPSDEYINTDTYGRTYSGYRIAYGKNNIESKTAGEFSVSFQDDRKLHIYQLHRLWVEYISGVFRGSLSPLPENIINKILDYASACYYFVTAEDGETIIFWSKYYGVFPTTVPSTQYAWGSGNVINNPQIDITYKYSFKEDFNPYTILEFNHNAKVKETGEKYVPIYDENLNHVGPTWVGSPYIELVEDPANGIYEFKLRFRPS